MKKETMVWQAIVLVLGVLMIIVTRIYLENNKTYSEKKIIVEAMKINADIEVKRANCFMLAEEKGLVDIHCQNMGTPAYKLYSERY